MSTNQDSIRLRVSKGALAISLCIWLPAMMRAQSPADAQALEQNENWKGAEAIWRKLAAVSPGDYRLWTSLGIVLAREQRYDDAAAAYRKALVLKPGDAQIELNLAITYFKAGKLPQALEPLRIAAREQPDNLQVETLLGMTLFGTSHYQEAIPYLEKSLGREGENPSLQQILAQSYLQAAEYQKALAVFQRMLERDPDSAPVHMLLGEAYDAQGEPDKAIAEFQTATTKGYTPDAHFGLGFLFWKAHRYDLARAQFEKELENDPKHSQALTYLGDIALKQNDLTSAEALLEKAIALKQTSRLAYLDLGIAETQQKRYQAAERDLKCAVELDPKKADAHYRLARLYQAMGRAADADRELASVRQLHEETREDLLLKVSQAPKGEQ